MNNHVKIIIDASVITKWYLADEQEREAALSIQDDFIHGKIAIILPQITLYEISNFFRSSAKRLRIDKNLAAKTYKEFIEADFLFFKDSNLLTLILEQAIELDISSYDASYVVLSEYLQIPFFTADKKLLLKAQGKYVHHLKDYINL